MENNEYFRRFGIILNRKVVKTPLAIASMAGIVDATYVLEREAHVGAAFIGGYSIDERRSLPAMRSRQKGDRSSSVTIRSWRSRSRSGSFAGVMLLPESI